MATLSPLEAHFHHGTANTLKIVLSTIKKRSLVFYNKDAHIVIHLDPLTQNQLFGSKFKQNFFC